MSFQHFQSIMGYEALSPAEHVGQFFAELSLSIDKFNAKHFGNSIHTVKIGKTFQELKAAGNYFDVSFKHIASPVLFDPKRMSFADYVDLCCQTVGALKIVTTVAENVYRGIKSTAAKGQVPVSMASYDTASIVFDMKAKSDEFLSTGNPTTRAVSELYGNWGIADTTFQLFNKAVDSLKGRDVEVLDKNVREVVAISALLKRKLNSGEITLTEPQKDVLNESLDILGQLVTYVGFMMNNLSELSRIMTLQIEQLPKLK